MKWILGLIIWWSMAVSAQAAGYVVSDAQGGVCNPMTPQAALGQYNQNGSLNGAPAYSHTSGAWHIYRANIFGADNWVVSNLLGSTDYNDSTIAFYKSSDVATPVANNDSVYGSTNSGCGKILVQALPSVAAVSPATGPTTGGNTVTITGADFSGTPTVRFGSTDATGVTLQSSTALTATVPAGSVGSVGVSVITTIGTSNADTQYSYAPAPTVSGVSPSAGPTGGGTTVTITGTNLSGATGVAFGAAAATGYTINSATSITATAPAGSAGTVDVQVTSVGGTSSTSASDRFTYVAAPAVTSISPTTGPATGGTTVTITGTNFSGTTAVTFGATAATGFTVNSATQITATAPAGTGTVDVRVTTVGGTSSTSASDRFTYVAAPAVTSISPTTGPTAGSTSVTITGTNFTGTTAVTFGATAATGFTVNSATQITATAPTGTGTVDLRVTTVGGTSSTSAGDQFTYAATPTVTGIAPTAGPIAGGTSVTITGTNFTGATAVTFGATAATGYTINSATSITATAPAGSAGTVDLRVTTVGGTSSTSAGDQFTYAATPTVTGIAPTAGPIAGGTSVTITGTNFTGATAVTFGATAATSFTVNSATSITATAPAGSAGTVDLRVTTAGGTSAISAADQFTYALLASLQTATGSGTTLTVSNPGPTCILTYTAFTGSSALPTPQKQTLPVGYTYPFVAVGFTADQCTPGSNLAVTLTFPGPVPANAVLMKYDALATPPWQTFTPSSVSGNQVTYTIADDGPLDVDKTAGRFTDPVILAVPVPAGMAAIPTLDAWGLALLSMLAGLAGVVVLTRNRYHKSS